MEASELLTIVIPTLNEEACIGRLLDSILTQDIDVSRIALFVADAHSTDRTREIANQYRDRLNLEVIEGGSLSFGRNQGAKRATTKYVVFIDADVEIKTPSVLRESIRLAEAQELDCVGLDVHLDSPSRFDRFLYRCNNLSMRLPFLRTYTAMYIFMRRDCFERLGGFNEKVTYAEDRYLLRSIPRAKFAVVPGHILTGNRRFKKTGRWKKIALFLEGSWCAVSGRDDFFFRNHKYFD